MGTLFGGDVHAGLSGLQLDSEKFDLGDGVALRKTYAHLMAPFLMAFKPAPSGEHHPAPWKATSGGFSFDVDAELLVPANMEDAYGSKIDVARTIVFLLRLGVNPATTLPAFANYSFSSLSTIPDNVAHIFPFEVQQRHFPLGVVGGRANNSALEWVKDRWPVTQRLKNDSAEFSDIQGQSKNSSLRFKKARDLWTPSFPLSPSQSQEWRTMNLLTGGSGKCSARKPFQLQWPN